ncbi:hypothetical protein [Hyalangium sp.]|uniref:hypothetical protein n=1 Tax=Hyalangium sp. TaxID=2028555 RepID=UPI002D5309E0|nr:hypothetical protein [Hyalangium sp.]HYH94828.1 hypothetical protein [Hyalangium sp.]
MKFNELKSQSAKAQEKKPSHTKEKLRSLRELDLHLLEGVVGGTQDSWDFLAYRTSNLWDYIKRNTL